MSLERTCKSIANLEGRRQITTAQMLDVIIRFVEETFVHNGVGDLSEMEHGDREALVIDAYALSRMLLSVVKQNEEMIWEQDDQEKLQDVFSQIEEVRGKLSQKKQEIQEIRNRKKTLEKEKKRLENQNGEIRDLSEECDTLEQDIKKINDVSLAGMEKKRDDLRRKLQQRAGHHEEILTQISNYNEKIAIENTKTEALEQELAKKESDCRQALEKKNQLEQTIQKLAEQKLSYEAWILECSTKKEQMMQNCEEYMAKYSQIRTAVNSILNEDYIRQHLYFQTGDSANLAAGHYPDLMIFPNRIDSPDALRKWLDTIQNRIGSLLAVYQEQLKKLVECSSRMTADI